MSEICRTGPRRGVCGGGRQLRSETYSRASVRRAAYSSSKAAPSGAVFFCLAPCDALSGKRPIMMVLCRRLDLNPNGSASLGIGRSQIITWNYDYRTVPILLAPEDYRQNVLMVRTADRCGILRGVSTMPVRQEARHARHLPMRLSVLRDPDRFVPCR